MEIDNQTNTATQQAGTQNVVENNAGSQTIDYNKIQSIIDGRNAKTEQSILKDYFGKQGLSEDEMKSAISTFKSNKEAHAQQKSQEFANLQNEFATIKAQNQQYQINDAARDVADDLGVETKVVPYLIKMANLSKVFNEKGEIDKEEIKNSLNEVLKNVPQLKSTNMENKGFVPKAGSNNDNNANTNDDVLKNIFGG